MSNKLCTQFLPPEKANETTLKRQVKLFVKTPLIGKLYNSVSEIVLILNSNRQIVFFNDNLVRFTKIKNPEDIYGLRIGEVFGCIHSDKVSGCGTTEFCKTCGGANAIRSSQADKKDLQECRISRDYSKDMLDLRVNATPLELGKENFSVFSVVDISHEKRRQALERVFFHDILNLASVIKLETDILKEKENTAIPEEIDELIDGINSQKELLAAENHEYQPKKELLLADDILGSIVKKFGKLADEKNVVLEKQDSESDQTKLMSDHLLISRILGNMLKNAIESSNQGEKVTVWSEAESNSIKLYVRNSSVMPRRVQLQIFQRSFSTKGLGRGIGTYSMKLFAERYLGGKVGFSSDKKNGTTFFLELPTARLPRKSSFKITKSAKSRV